ncbi:hypothetical protein Ae201684P_002821 [Aphanomyces euteiches]|uniref:Uncharacterized protein n=1 Tax=Aphanomyces euteiches TaxID=100861 RepID=A0A6G0X213_9STRA|nr:hypothetical protein Ae201684_009419 [Aphanomyces euteiches]KAH9070463.1 hypothetical protein Ae201684P_002821 [Aphanomyces euteiches]
MQWKLDAMPHHPRPAMLCRHQPDQSRRQLKSCCCDSTRSRCAIQSCHGCRRGSQEDKPKFVGSLDILVAIIHATKFGTSHLSRNRCLHNRCPRLRAHCPRFHGFCRHFGTRGHNNRTHLRRECHHELSSMDNPNDEACHAHQNPIQVVMTADQRVGTSLLRVWRPSSRWSTTTLDTISLSKIRSGDGSVLR